MAEEFDRGWYVRKNGSPFSPAPPVFFHAPTSEIEQRLIRDKPSQPNPR